MDQIEIVNLIEKQEYLEEVSKWIWREWSYEHGATLGDIIYRSKHSLNRNKIPSMYIALCHEEVVGVVSLWVNDLTSRQDLYPWMATLYVKESYRGKGIGKKLQEHCIEVVRNLGYENLYLITHHENYYEKYGWKFLEEAPLHNGEKVRVYQYQL
ncbi:MAG: GNAT family N-acetyltransferase [Bacilli bacterium]|nr:GNAT family N-acetyltransferase [Bacilli bacterium]